MGCGVDCFGIVVDGGGEGQPPRRGQMPAMAAAMRSRLRIAVGTINHRSRLPLSERVASRVPAFSRSTITAWMVPLWRRGSMPMARTRSLQVIGPSLIRRVRIAVRMMEVSIGCGAVVFGIVVGRGGEGQPSPNNCSQRSSKVSGSGRRIGAHSRGQARPRRVMGCSV